MFFKSKMQHSIELDVYTVHGKHVRFRACAVDVWARFWPTQSYFARSRFLLSLPLPLPHFFVLKPPKRDLGMRSLRMLLSSIQTKNTKFVVLGHLLSLVQWCNLVIPYMELFMIQRSRKTIKMCAVHVQLH